jgi:hypothetical protein
VTTNSVTALRSLQPLEVAGYLRAHGWHEEVELHGKASLWLREPDEELTLPARRDLGDYELRMEEVVQTLVSVEDRAEREIIRDLQTVTSDLIRVRVQAGTTKYGTIPMDAAVALTAGSRDLLLAAACAAINRRPVYANRKPNQALAYLDSVQMGQTERGSYILTILSPVPPELRMVQESFFPREPEDPYERKVTRTLMAALQALGSAARRAMSHGDLLPFQEAVSAGISANLCDAVVALSDANAGEGLDVQMAWSPTRPIGPGVPERVTLSRDAIPLIREAARAFRDTSLVEDVELEGVVTVLDRGVNAREGEVTITGNVEGQVRRVLVRLGEPTYSEAVKAHEGRQVVTCVGDLRRLPTSYRLENPRRFAIRAN